MRGQGEVQDLSAQNTISYVIKTDVLLLLSAYGE